VHDLPELSRLTLDEVLGIGAMSCRLSASAGTMMRFLDNCAGNASD
jgi:hypothetical protein